MLRNMILNDRASPRALFYREERLRARFFRSRATPRALIFGDESVSARFLVGDEERHRARFCSEIKSVSAFCFRREERLLARDFGDKSDTARVLLFLFSEIKSDTSRFLIVGDQ